MIESQARAAVAEHLAAFNGHDTQRILAGLADDIVWNTGQDVISGVDGLKDLFDDWLWGLDPSLSVRTLIAHENRVAAELTEELTVNGELRTFAIAAFFVVETGRIATAKIYREGTADIDWPQPSAVRSRESV